ncbi:MAG TPA: hypothetical protein VKZ88_06785 [Fibrobacteria bacterium]|jgi:hypothetical protein|nr:hypothetical protein [Fibrobacteria bacterium]
MIPMQNARRHPRFAARLAVIVLATVATAAHQPHAATSQFPARPAALSFSGLVDADFVSEFGDDFGTLRHITGLKLDLATTVTFSPTVAAVIQTTMNDGAVPAQGAGNTWATVRFDGVTLNWKYGDHTVIHIGDLRPGTGYFNYYRNKHTAVVVGEHALRGVGISRSGWTVATGATGLGATDTAGNPVASSQWSTFARYDYRIAAGVTLTPSLRYTAGVPGATPVVGGLSFDGAFGAFSLSLDLAGNYYSSSTDPGFTVLIEPAYAGSRFSLSSSFYFNEQGSGIPAPNHPVQTRTGVDLDRAYAYVEPGIAITDLVTLGLALEYHDAHDATAAALGYDESVWVVPALYLHPGAGAQWRIWGQATKPLSGTGSMDPLFFAGSEVVFRF